jgi:hypothetical protein
LKNQLNAGLPALFRSFSVSNIFRMRIDFGVTSRYSSFWMYSSASSSENLFAGAIFTFASLPASRSVGSYFLHNI